jgi:large subunit ribosomal protein L13
LLDAEDQILGRFATVVANKLRGKDKPTFTPHVDNGDFIVVVNAAKIKVTGNKFEQKKYYHHSLYPGGLKTSSFKEKINKDPQSIILKAVKGMLPKNKLASAMLKKLKVYRGEEHPHEAQKPTPLLS